MRRWAATTVAVGLVVGGGLLGAAPAQAADYPMDLPQGPDTTVPWYDKDAHVFHIDGAVVPSPVDSVRRHRTTSTGVLMEAGVGNETRLVSLDAAGRSRVVTTSTPRIWSWNVRTGSWAGRQVAAMVKRNGRWVIEARRIADSSLVRRTAPGGSSFELLGFHDTKVWYQKGERAYIWDVATGRRTSMALPDAEWRYVDVRLNLVARPSDQSVLRVRPLTGHRFRPWSRRGRVVVDMSPDGRYLVTSQPYDRELDPASLALEIRNARTGVVLRTLAGWYDYGNCTWEDSTTLLAPAHWPRPEDEATGDVAVVTVRSDILTGAQERVGDGISGTLQDGPTVLFPVRR
jgi:hypothetical protein